MTEIMNCPRCTFTAEVSDEDPDATQSWVLDHLATRHTGYDHNAALTLLAQVTITEQDDPA